MNILHQIPFTPYTFKGYEDCYFWEDKFWPFSAEAEDKER